MAARQLCKRLISSHLGATPLWEDVYDYGAAAAKYIDAFFQNIQWDEVQRRLERAQKVGTALRG